MTIRNLDALLQPASVALIGASPEPGSIGLKVTENLLTGGFRGPIHLVNPRHAAIAGHPCHPSIDALPAPPALAIVATPPRTLPVIAGDLARTGTRAAVVITAGLSAEEKQRMLEAGRPALLRVLGPNGIGLMLPQLGLNATFAHRAAAPGRLAFLSQSGALVTAVIDWAAGRDIGFSHVISLGDMADVDFGDLLDYLAGDVQSSAILLYMEAVTSAPKFLSAARRAARAKPVVVIKSGRHAAGARAAASHTGRLAGADAAYDAAFRRAGLLRVYEMLELFDAAEMLARVPRLQGERLMVLTNGGGAGVLAADRIADYDGTLARLPPEAVAALDGALPANWSRANPVDIIGDAGAGRYGQALEVLLDDPGTDALLVIHCPVALASATDIARQTIAAVEARRGSGRRAIPVLTNWLGDPAVAESRALFANAGVPSFETPGAAARGFMHLVRYTRAQDALLRTPPAVPEDGEPDRDGAARVIRAALDGGRTMLSEAEGKALLKAYRIPVVETFTAASPAEAADVAGPLIVRHGAVALKILSDDISHKSDVGGVRLDLADAGEVRAAAEAMLGHIGRLLPAARIAGFTVQPMIRRPRAHELILGMTVDATFGPLILFGTGGTATETVRDTALALPPLDQRLARDLIGETRIARLLAGYRDRPAVDIDAVARALVALSGLACDHPEVRELDVNPLIADEMGIIALDARVRIADERQQPRTPLSIRPYPARWRRAIVVDGIGEVMLRPIRPEDEALYADFLQAVTAEDHRLRFFGPRKELSHRLIARLTQVDYAREIAFVAIETAGGRLLGVSRFAADPDHVRAEYAVLVRSDLKGRGLGWQLMRQLIDYARAGGLSELFGSVLAENTTMLRMCGELGFRISPDPDDPGVRTVSLDVRPAA